MTPNPPNEEALYDAARNLSEPEARRVFLDQACAGFPELRERLEKLLAAETEAENFFKDAARGPAQIRLPERPAGEAPNLPGEGQGTRVGNYKLLQKIGEGGCGVVYMAEQEQPVRRRVALKIIKLGMDTKSIYIAHE